MGSVAMLDLGKLIIWSTYITCIRLSYYAIIFNKQMSISALCENTSSHLLTEGQCIIDCDTNYEWIRLWAYIDSYMFMSRNYFILCCL